MQRTHSLNIEPMRRIITGVMVLLCWLCASRKATRQGTGGWQDAFSNGNLHCISRSVLWRIFSCAIVCLCRFRVSVVALATIQSILFAHSFILTTFTVPLNTALPVRIVGVCHSVAMQFGVMLFDAGLFSVFLRRLAHHRAVTFLAVRLQAIAPVRLPERLTRFFNPAFGASLCGSMGLHIDLQSMCHASGCRKQRGGFVLPSLYQNRRAITSGFAAL